MMGVEVIEYGGTTYAEIIWAGTDVEKTTFFSPAESSFQFGLLAHDGRLSGGAPLPQDRSADGSTTSSRCSSCSAASSTSSSTPTTAGSSG